MTVQDLVDVGEDRDVFDEVVKTTHGLGEVGLQNYINACADTKPGEAPEVDYYTSMIPTPTRESTEQTRMSGAMRSGWLRCGSPPRSRGSCASPKW